MCNEEVLRDKEYKETQAYNKKETAEISGTYEERRPRKFNTHMEAREAGRNIE